MKITVALRRSTLFQRLNMARIIQALTILLIFSKMTAAAAPVSMSDEDILNPSKLIYDQVLDFTDSFDGSLRGKIFVTKRSILGSPDKDYGVIGEKGSKKHNQVCQFFCPPGTTEIDAVYLYVFEIKGECEIGVRSIGWTELKKSYDGILGPEIVTGIVRYTSQPVNIPNLSISGLVVGPPSNLMKLTGPHGTNYKYFPRNKGLFSQTTADSTNLSAGFITDIHYFSATQLVKIVNSGQELNINFPSWKPSVFNVLGDSLEKLKTLTAKCA